LLAVRGRAKKFGVTSESHEKALKAPRAALTETVIFVSKFEKDVKTPVKHGVVLFSPSAPFQKLSVTNKELSQTTTQACRN
jgi:hypothetical protein